MNNKIFSLSGVGDVIVQKRSGNRHARLSFDSHGQVRVSIPKHAPYRIGVAFALRNKAWITKHRPIQTAPLSGDTVFLQKYHLRFISGDYTSVRSKLTGFSINIYHPTNLSWTDDAVQVAAKRGIKRLLRAQAEIILPERLSELGQSHGFGYRSVKIKDLKRRWGSCDQAGNITLNMYLVQLKSEQIDYVLLHELVHTVAQNHQKEFWEIFEEVLPQAKATAKEVRRIQPGLFSSSTTDQ